MRRSWVLLCVMILSCALGVTLPTRAADSFSFASIDVPSATETGASGINDAGQIVGFFSDSDARSNRHGFLRASDGTFTTINVPGPNETWAYGINSAGQIVGDFDPGGLKIRCFLRATDGAFTTIDVPGATITYACRINGTGQIVGTFVVGPVLSGKFHGFVRTAGAITTLDVPGAAHTEAHGISGSGQIVGAFKDAGGKWHGYVRAADGAFTTFDAPGATETRATGINDAGQIVGWFAAAHTVHGFLWCPFGYGSIITADFGITFEGQVRVIELSIHVFER